MIKPNTTIKALVPYSPSLAKRNKFVHRLTNIFLNNDLAVDNTFINSFYTSRSKYYLFFTGVFFLASVFSAGLYFCNDYGEHWYITFTDKFIQFSFNDTVWFLVISVVVYRLLAFLGSFTVFSFPATLLCSLRIYLVNSFFFVAAQKSLLAGNLLQVWYFVLLFSLNLFFDIFFFAESCKFYNYFKKSHSIKAVLAYTFAFVIYAAIVVTLTWLRLRITVNFS